MLHGFRSGLEDKVAGELDASGHAYQYEEFRVSYTIPSRLAKYTPDFIIPANGIVVETKGRFLTADRQKHLLIQKEHPNLDIRFVFSNANTRISKQSATTYAMWCRTHDFQFANKSIPSEWLSEAPSAARMEALNVLIPAKQKASK
ncbi:endodeoxyribonuclease [Sinorhizobium medicae]|nr:endodeoxyribonuclease [Sinorhizobium meliloti]RVH84269.1 endodeoxyribonuclease [Sinorhizobium medicae]RVP63943.1 endodeoxyribonuclease [Sinorhizobium medicae]